MCAQIMNTYINENIGDDKSDYVNTINDNCGHVFSYRYAAYH